MLWPALFALVALAPACAIQVPLHDWQNTHPILRDDEPTQWSLDEIPDPNATDHLVFETVYSLLQNWPNVRIINGHNIVPGIIPEGTLLYHGADHEELPPGAEWVAFDPELAHRYCRRGLACWHLTLTTTRPLKVVYFDGSSAEKVPTGSLDTQDLLAWGESLPEHVGDEVQRIENLCRWGKSVGVDGFIRMGTTFGVMLCNFTSGVDVVTFSNVVSALGLPPDISARFVMFETLNAGARHSHFPGETRIHLDLSGLLSFYDTQLVPSLVAFRIGKQRWEHRVRDVSKEDLSAAVSRLEAALIRPLSPSSIDWKTLIQVLIVRYAGRLELTQQLLNSTITNPAEILGLASKTQMQLRIMLTPYMHLSAAPTDWSNKTALDWTAPIYRDCATSHTKLREHTLYTMTDSERLLLRAVRGTTREICRVVTKMWTMGVYAGIDPSLNTGAPVDIVEMMRVWNVWAEDLERLMSWLDWNVWIKCKPICGPMEVCFLHQWPYKIPHSSEANFDAMEGFAENPFPAGPKCVSLVDP